MLTYFVLDLASDGQYHIGYQTPGAPHVITTAGSASTKEAAERECARLNELQVVERRTDLVRAANFLPLDLGKEH